MIMAIYKQSTGVGVEEEGGGNGHLKKMYMGERGVGGEWSWQFTKYMRGGHGHLKKNIDPLSGGIFFPYFFLFLFFFFCFENHFLPSLMTNKSVHF